MYEGTAIQPPVLLSRCPRDGAIQSSCPFVLHSAKQLAFLGCSVWLWQRLTGRPGCLKHRLVGSPVRRPRRTRRGRRVSYGNR